MTDKLVFVSILVFLSSCNNYSSFEYILPRENVQEILIGNDFKNYDYVNPNASEQTRVNLEAADLFYSILEDRVPTETHRNGIRDISFSLIVKMENGEEHRIQILFFEEGNIGYMVLYQYPKTEILEFTDKSESFKILANILQETLDNSG